MSLILDALHRSDQERSNQAAVVGLHTLHQASSISKFNHRGGLLAVAVLVLAFASWVLLGDLWRGNDVESANSIPMDGPAAGEPAAGEPAAGEPAANKIPESETAGSAQSVAALSSPVEPVTAAVSSTGPGIATSTRKRVPEVALTIQPGVAQLYQRIQGPGEQASQTVAIETDVEAPPTADAESAAGNSLPVDAILTAVQQELAAPPRDHDPTPLVQDLPQDTRDALPSIFFSNHSWSNQGMDKHVTLNGELLREGDMVMPDVRLVEIMPEYIVLEFRGTRFRLRALNSWVNL